MHASNVLGGSVSFAATGFARVTLLTQLGFHLGRAVTHALNPRNVATPVADARIEAMFNDESTGPAVVSKLDAEVLCEAYAAAYILLRSHINQADPETGRREEHLRKRLVGPADQIIAAYTYAKDQSLGRSIDQAKAECKMLGADPTARIAAITAAQDQERTLDVKPYETFFFESLKKLVGKETSELIDVAVEGFACTDRNLGLEIQNSAKAFLDFQRKRAERGEFVKVDAGVYALAKGESGPIKVMTPAEVAAQAAAADALNAKVLRKQAGAAKRAATIAAKKQAKMDLATA